jgi:hypothetical protein
VANGQLGHDQRQLSAYDCTSPQELRAVTKAEPPQCQDRLDQDPVSKKNKTYLLLQKATYRRQPVSRCKVLRTRVAHHCRDNDHQTFIPQFSTFREELTVLARSVRQCTTRKSGYTVGLEEGWFLTYARELMYHYSCRPIIVVGRDDTLCYSALPIDLVVEDQKRIAANRGDEDTNGTTGFTTHSTGYFLEPHTRRLTFWGTHMPCVRNLGGAYLNTRGGWVVALPHLLLMEKTQTLKQHEELEYVQGKLRKYDLGFGGIYDKALVRVMEKFTQTRRLREDVGTVLLVQGSKFADPSHISPHDLWQEIPQVSFNFLGWLGDMLDQWSNCTSRRHCTAGLFKGLILHLRFAGQVLGGP